MTSVDETVRDAILTHPSLFQSRYDVLAHVLCTPAGGGYKWTKRGEVVYEDLREFNFGHWNRQEQIDKHIASIFELDTLTVKQLELPFIQEEFGEWLAEQDEYQNVVDNVDTMMRDMIPRSKKLIPEGNDFHEQWGRSLLDTAPENVKPDWAEASNQMREVAAKFGWVFDGSKTFN